jgi:hypothetical protein
MREPRNPFRLRASEHIESDTAFVRLFGPGMLDLLKSEDGLDRLRILRSAPGGGKTTLMRLFTPGPLLTLHSFRLQEDCKELYQRMSELGAVAESGPRALGVMVSCDRNYAALADVGFDPVRQLRAFFALLDARLMMAALRGALTLKRLNYPADLARLEIAAAENVECPPGIQLPCKGTLLHDWARKLEDSICDALDSFSGVSGSTITGGDGLFTLKLLNTRTLLCDGAPVADRLLVILDDVHKLTRPQRQGLMETAVNSRIINGLWLAERLEALSFCDLLSQGAIMGRDYQETFIENSWRERPKQFEKLVLNIAQRRVDQAVEVETQSFSGALESSLDDTLWQPKHEQALTIVKDRVKRMDAQRGRYAAWIAEREQMQGTPRQLAVAWRMLEILVEREERKSQKAFGFAFDAGDLQAKDDSSLRTAAELFLADEFKIPFFFGSSMLARLASSNVEQFLWMAGDQFEEVASVNVINPKEQRCTIPELTHDRDSVDCGAWDPFPRVACARVEISLPTGGDLTAGRITSANRLDVGGGRQNCSNVHRLRPHHRERRLLRPDRRTRRVLETRLPLSGDLGLGLGTDWHSARVGRGCQRAWISSGTWPSLRAFAQGIELFHQPAQHAARRDAPRRLRRAGAGGAVVRRRSAGAPT